MHRPVLIAALALSCNKPGADPETRRTDPPPPVADTVELSVQPISIPEAVGLSGLTAADDGTLWSVPERDSVLIAIPPGEATPRAVPVDGLDGDHQLESLTWLGGGRFALGTEGDCRGNASRILFVTTRADEGGTRRAALDDRTIEIPHKLWLAICRPNHGVEAVCHADGTLLAALEHAELRPGGRLAPLARIDLASGELTPLWVRLSSKTGKISAMDCRSGESGIEVLAVERHFKVSRLLRFTVPTADGADGTEIAVETLVDLWPYTISGKRNLEGVVRLGSDSVALIVDNHFGRVTGPTELLRLPLPTTRDGRQ